MLKNYTIDNVNDEPIAYIKMIDDKTYHFYWYGFYNKKQKKESLKKIVSSRKLITKKLFSKNVNKIYQNR